jgi:hypothetical protein
MKSTHSAHSSNRFPIFQLCVFLFVALLAAILLIVPNAAASVGESLHQFQGGSDGQFPYVGLVADNAGNLYGTTNNGGGSSSCQLGCGIVFELSPPAEPGGTWTETILHAFQGGNDGANPEAPLIFDAAGNLWGTTSWGGDGNCSVIGQSGCGTIFELTASGTTWNYQTIYSFQGVPSGQGAGDAAWPMGIAFDKNGTLFGFGFSGGRCWYSLGEVCAGAAFELTNSSGNWKESVIYVFNGPYYGIAGPIIDSQGNLYGGGPGGRYTCGAIFQLRPPKNGKGWTEHGIYNFHGTTDGAFPNLGLIFDSKFNLYASTIGAFGNPSNVIELAPTTSGEWTETVLYNFHSANSGYTPNWGPIVGSDGNLYGTTEDGGHYKYGTVYELVPPSQNGEWTDNVLYSFSSGSNGTAPGSGLIFGKDARCTARRNMAEMRTAAGMAALAAELFLE